ncbi:uroporphyrinogen decarboxylase [Alkalibacter rhizosphaerae]|uniref:Uroporphyrinogen decarboxylase n=1 Tax=Alkalibacter rhizosphaerae TaxID=2815577 RepID=A0A974XFQ1_9FIRM|nr:uroporphyrinogen decarboxylase family protein [Alkalibacter rhizosphaerae]QSX09012.1 uroporphyrinogen decarboxylase [Alkalibacter rhizosphaerae]
MTEQVKNPQEKKAYRTKLFEDLYTGIIPDRIPVWDTVGWECLIQYAGKDLMTTQYQYKYELILEILEKGMEICRGDMPVGAFARNPIALMFQKSIVMEMSQSGFIQHAEKSVMDPDEYDEFIKNPHDFVLETLEPRLNKAYSNEVMRARSYVKAVLSHMEQAMEFGRAEAEIVEKYGLFTRPMGSVGMQVVPFDYITDMYRGFSKIPLDMKRCPEKLLEALEAVMPYAIWMGEPNVISPLGCNMIMTHMAAFLSTEQFEKFYFPTFNKVCHIAAEKGQAMQIFLEGDWTRFIDHLQELPQGTQLWMEYGDPQKFKDKLGKKMVLGGFYPITLLSKGTKQQCIDKAKELMDIMAPGGNYQFISDKAALVMSDLNPENYVAVLEYVLENGKYSNAGEQVTTAKKEDSIQKYSHLYPKFESKYVESFEELTKDHPPADPRVEPLMREHYNKYHNMIDRGFFL